MFLVELIYFLDIPIKFHSAYFSKKNYIIISKKRIYLNYLKNDLLFDLLAVFPFFLFLSFPLCDAFKLLKLYGINKNSIVYDFIRKQRKANLIRLILLSSLYLLFAQVIGLVSTNFIPLKTAYSVLTINELNQCKQTSSFEIDLKPNCFYNIGVYYGLSFVLSEDIEIYDLSFLYFFFFASIFIKVVVSVISGYLTNYVFLIWYEEIKEKSHKRHFFDSTKNLKIDKETTDELQVMWKHLDKNKNKHRSMTDTMSNTINEQFTAVFLTHLVHRLTFIRECGMDDVILGQLLRLMTKYTYGPLDYVYRRGEVTKGFYLFSNGKLDFSAVYQLPYKIRDEDNWLNLEPRDIRSNSIIRKD